MAQDKRIYKETFQRSAKIESRAFNDEKRTVELAFSSEEPVERWFGAEILDHSKGSVDLSRLQSGAAVLVNHNADDHVGVVESARVDDDRRGRAVVRFGNSARANEVWNDVKDGIRGLVSVGYRINEVETKRAKKDDELDEVRVTSWQPMEISIVSVPADATVGVGRSAEKPIKPDKPAREDKMSEENKEVRAAAPVVEQPKAPSINIEVIREEARRGEQERIAEINDAATRMSKHDAAVLDHAKNAIANGESADSFRKRLFSLMREPQPVGNTRGHEELGMSDKEIRQFSFQKAISEAANGKLTGLEREASDAYEKASGQSPQSFWIPPDVLFGERAKRDLTVGTGSQAGNLVATNLLAGSFIDLLRNRMVMSRLGARFLTGLVGNVTIPRQTAGVSAAWQASETASVTEGNMTVDLVTLTPHTLHARQDLTKLLMQQATPAVEQLVRNDLANALALALDAAGIDGTNTAQPEGILNVSGIGSVAAGGTATVTSALTWGNVVGLETEVAVDNADMGSLAYLTRATVRGSLKTVEKATNTGLFVWQDSASPQIPGEGVMNGYRAVVSQQVPNDLTAGTFTNATALIFGNFGDYIYAQWGGIDVLVNPYTQASTRIIEVHSSMFADGTVRHAESFAASQNVLDS